MKLLKMACCCMVLSCSLYQGYAQIPKALPANPLRQVAIPTDSTLMKNAVKAGKRQFDTLLGIAKAPLQPLTGELKLFEGGKPVSFNQLDVEADYSYFRDTSGMGLGVFSQSQGMVGYNINYAMSLQSMPFNLGIRETNGINTLNYTPFQNFYKFNFDHTKYLESIRTKMMQKLNPDVVMASALSRVNSIRHNYEQGLQSEISQLQGEYAKEYKSSITLPANATNLSANDMGALQNQLVPGSALEKYRKDLARLQEMEKNKDAKTLAADTSYHSLQGEVKKYETLENIYGKITGYKKKFENNAFVKELKSHLPFNPNNFKSYLADPKNLESVLDDQGGLSQLQRLFVNVNKLDLGQNAVQSGELAMQNTMNTGVNTEFKNKSTTLGMIYGKNNSVNNWQQAGLSSQVTNEYTSLTGFKIGTGSGSPVDQSLSFNFFNFNNTPGPSGQLGPAASSYLPLAPHKDGVISLHTGVQLSPEHSISLDVSKSFGSFQQNVTGDSSLNKAIPGGSVFNNAGKSNYAAVLSYAGQLWKTDLKLYAKTVGLGYNNPGNPLLRTGESQLGLGFSRKFFRQRLTAKYDGDYKHQVFDPAHNYTYRALTNKWQLGFKIDRNDKVNLTYQRSDYHSAFYGQPATGGVNSRLQLDGAYRFIVGRKKVMNNITISHQQINLPMVTGGNYSNNTLLVTNTSSLMLGKNMLSLTILENHSDNRSYFFNTSLFSSEANYTYPLSESGNIRMSSGMGYYDNAGWNRQLGAKQQISALLKEKLTLDFQVGIRKAIQTIRPQLADQLFLNSTVHYTFK